jgi:hypothetical protein
MRRKQSLCDGGRSRGSSRGRMFRKRSASAQSDQQMYDQSRRVTTRRDTGVDEEDVRGAEQDDMNGPGLVRGMETAPLTSFSSSLVCAIIEMVLSRSKSSTPELLLVRRSRDLRASAIRPFRTSHHGDSGARKATMMSGMGQNHYMIKPVSPIVSRGLAQQVKIPTHLESVRDTPSPLVRAIQQASQHAKRDELTDSPTGIDLLSLSIRGHCSTIASAVRFGYGTDPCGEVSTQHNRCDLGRIGCRQCLEDYAVSARAR